MNTASESLSINVHEFPSGIPGVAPAPAARPAIGLEQAARFAHDLNNLLTPVVLSLELAGNKLCNPAYEALFGLARNNILQATGLMSEVVASASGRRGPRVEINPWKIARLANELNSLLAPVLSSLDLVRGELHDPADRTMFDLARKSLLLATEMTSEIVASASGRRDPRPVIDPRIVAEDVVAFARKTFPSSIHVQFENGERPALVASSSADLHRALVNLCINARDAMPAGGTLRLRVTGGAGTPSGAANQGRECDSHVLIEVSDTGSGISEALRVRIFEPYFTTKAPGKGSGLGLASVKEMVESHGGCLLLQTEVGKGTTFQIFLPVA